MVDLGGKKNVLEVYMTGTRQRRTLKLKRKDFLSPLGKDKWEFHLDGEKIKHVQVEGDINMIEQSADVSKGLTIWQLNALSSEELEVEKKGKVLKLTLTGLEGIVDAATKYSKRIKDQQLIIDKGISALADAIERNIAGTLHNLKDRAEFADDVEKRARESYGPDEGEGKDEQDNTKQPSGKQPAAEQPQPIKPAKSK